MRNHLIVLATALLVWSFNASARADLDLQGVVLVGSGVDTGNNPDNPYALQIGGAAEVIYNGYVVGFRGTRAVGSGERSAVDFRALGGDFGFEWEIALLHLGPRLGIGRISTRNGEWHSGFIDPGAVAEIELGWFVIGADVRYRVVFKESDANGLLAYARIGLRF